MEVDFIGMGDENRETSRHQDMRTPGGQSPALCGAEKHWEGTQ